MTDVLARANCNNIPMINIAGDLIVYSKAVFYSPQAIGLEVSMHLIWVP